MNKIGIIYLNLVQNKNIHIILHLTTSPRPYHSLEKPVSSNIKQAFIKL